MRVKLPLIDRIWRVRSSIPIEDDLSAAEAFERLDPLLQTQGTQFDIDGNTLTYSKKNPSAQDKLATFTHGSITVEQKDSKPVLAYDLSSTALALCFLAPLLFLAFAYLAIGLNTLHPSDRDRTQAEESEDEDETVELHWIDQMLGVPTPETKEEKEEREAKEKEENGGEEEEEGVHASEPAFALAGIFAVIFLVGRFLEPYLIRRTFRTALRGGFIATPSGPRLRDDLDSALPAQTPTGSEKS